MVPSPPITAGLGHLELNDLERWGRSGHLELIDLEQWGRSSSTKWGEITEHPEGPLIAGTASQPSPIRVVGPLLHGSFQEDRGPGQGVDEEGWGSLSFLSGVDVHCGSRSPGWPRAELGPGMESGCQDRGVGVVVRRLSSPWMATHRAGTLRPAGPVGRSDPRARETRGSQSRWLDQLRGEPLALCGRSRAASRARAAGCERPAVDTRPGSPAGRRRARIRAGPATVTQDGDPGPRPGWAGLTHPHTQDFMGLWVTAAARGRTGPGPGGINAFISLMRKLRLRETCPICALQNDQGGI